MEVRRLDEAKRHPVLFTRNPRRLTTGPIPLPCIWYWYLSSPGRGRWAPWGLLGVWLPEVDALETPCTVGAGFRFAPSRTSQATSFQSPLGSAGRSCASAAAPIGERLRRFLSILIPSCLSFRPASASRQQLHSATMRLLSLLEAERKSGAIWYENLRQSPKLDPSIHIHDHVLAIVWLIVGASAGVEGGPVDDDRRATPRQCGCVDR